MNIIPVKLEEMEKSILELGFAGENMCTGFSFACDSVFSEYPDAVPSMAVTPPKGSKYPVVVARDGNNVLWNVTDSDTAYMGNGEVQLIFTQNNVIKRSYTCRTRILKSIIAEGTPPDPVQSWIDSANEMLAEIPETIDAAIDTAIAAAKASGEFKGDPGFSPVVTTAPITGGNSVTITDEQGDHTFNVLNGANGVSPDLSVTPFTGGHRITIVDASGTNTFDVTNGVNGTDATPDLITVDYANLTFPVAKGATCYHNGQMFEAKVAIQTAEEWDSTKWDPITVEGQIGNVLNAIQGIEEEKAPVITEKKEGNYCIIEKGEKGMQLQSCIVRFHDLQTGITGVKVNKCKRNIFDETTAPIYKYYIEFGSESNSRWIPSADSGSYVFEAKPNTQYIIGAYNPLLTIMRVCALNVDPSTLSGQQATTTNARNTPVGKKEVIITTKADERWIVIQLNSSRVNNRECNLQIEYGINSSEYEAYNGNVYSVSWGDIAGTVNSGYVDIVKGELVTLEPDERTYELEPIHITISDGVNTIYSNVGTIETEYPANTKKYIDDIQKKTSDGLLLQLHTKPENDGVLNAIKRARQITDMQWTPCADLPRTAFVTGNLYTIGSEIENYEDEFTDGKEYVGLPYGDTNDSTVQIGTGRPVDVFFTCVYNPDSVLYAESVYSVMRATYYCGSCTSLTAYALGLPYVISRLYDTIPHMVKMYDLTTNGVRHSLDDLKLCDVLQINGHCALITDLYKDDDGNLYLIEVSENTRGGGVNKNIIGSPYGGIARRRTFTIDEFYDRFSDFCIMRYRDIDKVKYIDCPYIQMPGEGKRFCNPYFPIMPYLGNKCLIKDERTVDLIISATGYTHVVVKKNGVNWNENGTADPYVLNGNSISITCDNDTAEYSAQLAKFANNEIQYGTVPCEWFVLNSVSVSATINSGKVNFTLTIDTDMFDPWFTNIRDLQETYYGYNDMIYDQFEHTQSGSTHIYTFTHIFSGSNPSKYVIGLWSDKYGSVEIKGSI